MAVDGRRAAVLTFSLALSVASSACVYPYRVEDAPPPPARPALPELEQQARAPARPGFTRVVLDSASEAGGAAKVIEIVEEGQVGARGDVSTRLSQRTRVVCERTPCLAELAVGDHDLRFLGDKVGDFQPGARVPASLAAAPSIFRVTLSRREREKTSTYDVGKVLGIGGFALVAGGGVALGITESLPNDNGNPYRITTLSIVGAGVATLIVATILQLSGRGDYRPGSFAQWAITAR